MKKIDEEAYMRALEDALEKGGYKNKEKIEEVINADFSREMITNEVYEKAIKRMNEYYKNNMKAKIKITKYDTIEQLEKDIGLKVEGHKYRKIEGIEDLER